MVNLNPIKEWLKTALPSKLIKIEQLSDTYGDFWKSLLLEELEETLDALHNNNEGEVLDGCVDIIWMVLNIVNKLNLWHNFEYKFYQVAASNNSKFTTSKKEVLDTIEAYRNNTHPSGKSFKEVYFEKILFNGDHKYLIYTLIDGEKRILKPIKSYKEPDSF